MRQPTRTVLPAAMAALLAAPALAQQRPALPLWELGVFGGAISQQAYPGADEQVNRGLVLPWVVYRGEFLRADRNALSVRAFRSPQMELDIGFSGSFGSSSDDIAARRGMPDLGTLVEFGPRLSLNLGEAAGGRWRAELPLRGVFDLSDGAARRGLAFEPELQFSRSAGGWRYSTSVSAVIADRKLADTFYGVAPQYATVARPAYNARSGLVAWRLSLSASRAITPDWTLFGYARLQSVAGAANRASPLVRQTTGASVGIAAVYTWMRSERPAVD